MKLYSYILKNDGGFSPNPFHGACTLACCKPSIRRTARVGDLIIGLATRGEHIVYAMRVARVFTFVDYWSAYPIKRPTWGSPRYIDRVGDNIYEPTSGEFRQLPSEHSNRDGTERLKNKVHDLGGRHVLVAERFGYLGHETRRLPPELAFLKIGRGHRCRFTADQTATVERWFDVLPQGVHGRPAIWPANDGSWRQP